MSKLKAIEQVVRHAGARRRLQVGLEGFGAGLLAGASVFFLFLIADKLFPLPSRLLAVIAAVAGLGAIAGFLIGARRKAPLLETARWVDARQHLQERLSSALEFASADVAPEWSQLILNDATAQVASLDPRKLFPLRWPRLTRWVLLVLATCAGLGFVPEHRSTQFRRQQQESANIRETGRQIAELTRQNLLQHPPALPPTQKAMTEVAEFGEKLTHASLTRSEALRDLASAADKLKEEVKQLESSPAWKPLERAAREASGGNGASPGQLQKQIDSLQKNLGAAAAPAEALQKLEDKLRQAQQQSANLSSPDSGASAREQLSQTLADLAQQAKELGVSLPSLDESIAALKANQTDLFLRDLQAATTDLEKLKDMTKSLQQLQQQMAKLGKDLAEQLKNGQAEAAENTLQRMAAQLQSPGLTPEQIRSMLNEVAQAVAPGSQFGQVGELLKNAAQKLGRNEKPGAAQDLAQAAKELEKMRQQLADSDAIREALESLARAEESISLNKSWEECTANQCSNCQGHGCALCRGTGRRWGQGGRPGSGVGTWADDQSLTYSQADGQRWDNSGVQRPDLDPRGQTDRPDDLNPNLAPSKVRGQISPGGSMPSITLKGVSIKGTSSVKFEEAAAAAQSAAQNALNADQVPRAYQATVRDYFDDLKK